MRKKTTPKEDGFDYNEIIRILGEEKVEQLHFILGSTTISMAAVKSIIRRQKILSCLNEGESVPKIASRLGVSRMTVYRHLKNQKLNNTV
ncbi:MAG: helix-turn-helix domain-containing protein [Bacteroidetes bacterium]|nr:helix-turn-helix domain-containing protein [Bacteroidota bacterium]